MRKTTKEIYRENQYYHYACRLRLCSCYQLRNTSEFEDCKSDATEEILEEARRSTLADEMNLEEQDVSSQKVNVRIDFNILPLRLSKDWLEMV